MRIENINISNAEQNQQLNINNKQQDYQELISQKVQLKVSEEEDSLEMLDKDKNKFENKTNIYAEEQRMISNIQASEMLIYRTGAILNNIKELVVEATDKDLKIQDRQDKQFTIDDFVNDIKNISYSIKERLGIEDYNPNKLGLDGVLSLAKMGKVTIKSRYGKSERISVTYTGKQNRSIIIEADKNTGDIGIKLRQEQKNKEKYFMKNMELKEILEGKGYLVEIDDQGEEEFVEEGNITLKQINETVGLNIMNIDSAIESLEKVDQAMEQFKENNKRISQIRDNLELSISRREIDDWEIDVESKEDAEEKIEKIKEYIHENKELRDYINRIQNPDLVYHLLR